VSTLSSSYCLLHLFLALLVLPCAKPIPAAPGGCLLVLEMPWEFWGWPFAVLIALVAAGRRRISSPILLLILLEIGAVEVVSWFSPKLVKNPWF